MVTQVKKPGAGSALAIIGFPVIKRRVQRQGNRTGIQVQCNNLDGGACDERAHPEYYQRDEHFHATLVQCPHANDQDRWNE